MRGEGWGWGVRGEEWGWGVSLTDVDLDSHIRDKRTSCNLTRNHEFGGEGTFNLFMVRAVGICDPP